MKAIVYTKYGLPDASYYQTLSTLLLSVGNWTYLLGLGLVFTISALILNFVLYQSKLIPRWLSGWSLVGAALLFTNYLLESFSINPVEILFLQIGLYPKNSGCFVNNCIFYLYNSILCGFSCSRSTITDSYGAGSYCRTFTWHLAFVEKY